MTIPLNVALGPTVQKNRAPIDGRSLRVVTIGRVAKWLTTVSCLCHCFSAFGFDDDLFRTRMLSAQDALDKSYTKSFFAEDCGKRAAAAAKEACPSDMGPATVDAAKLYEEAERLTEEANVFAQKALTDFRSAETLAPERPEPIFGEG